MGTEASKNTETVKMVSNAMKVLEILKENDEPKTLETIAKLSHLSPTTTARILKTLEHSNWAVLLNDNYYIAGSKTSFLIDKTNFYRALSDVAEEILKKYAIENHTAMNLMIFDGTRCEIIQQGRTGELIDYIPPLHTKLPFYSCAGGKVLLSAMPDILIENLLTYTEMYPLTTNTISSPEQFRSELREAAQTGYAIDYHESLENGCCIAVPVYNPEGTVIASVSFSGILEITDQKELLDYIPILKEVSEEISHALYRN